MELVIFMGLQGAGKTGFYRERFAATHVHVSKDLLRNSGDRQARQLTLIERALREGKSVAVDNTNPCAGDRAPLIGLARSFGVRVIAYYFEANIAECLERNARRGGRARVPDVAIYSTAAKFEPPTAAEGFDELFRVRLSADRFETVIAQ
jgi:predicted kinase